MARNLKPLGCLLVLIAFLPVITALSTWDTDGKLTQFEYKIRHHSYPAILLECSVIVIALISGLRPIKQLQALKGWQTTMLGVVALSAVLSANSVGLYQTEAWVATSVWAIHLVFAFSLLFFARTSEVLTQTWFWISLAISALAYVALVLVFVVSIEQPASFPWVLRMPGVTNVRHTGYFVAPAIGVLVALCITRERSTHLYFLLAALAVLVCYGSWSGSRGIFLALSASITLGFFVYSEFRKLKFWIAPLAAAAAGLVISTTFPVPSPSFGLVTRMSLSTGAESPDFSSGRTMIWNKTLAVISDRPLLGRGAGQYRNTMTKHTGLPLNHPHNLILQILFQWGAIGAIGFFSLTVAAWVSTLRVSRLVGSKTAPAFLVLNSLLAYSLFDGTGYYPLPIALVLIAAAAIFSSKWHHIEMQNSHRRSSTHDPQTTPIP